MLAGKADSRPSTFRNDYNSSLGTEPSNLQVHQGHHLESAGLMGQEIL